MSTIVPVLDFVHALNSAGIEADFATAIRNAPEYWNKLSLEQRNGFLQARASPRGAEDVSSLRVVRRRGAKAPAEKTFVIFDYAEDGGVLDGTRRFGRSLLYRNIEDKDLAAPEDPTDLTPFVRGGIQSHRDVLKVLDAAWGAPEGYDVARDGALCHSEIPPWEVHLDSYWLEEPFSKAIIVESEDRERTYRIAEPLLTPLEEALARTVNERLRDVLILENAPREDMHVFLMKKVFSLLRLHRFRLERQMAYKIGYKFYKNYLGLGPLDALMRDANVEDVSCNGPALPVFVAHTRYQSLRTNLSFPEAELNSYTMKLAQRGGKLLSIAQPLVDASLPDGSRLQAALGHEVTSRGSAFTIRKFREDPLTAVDLIKNGTHSTETMAALWLAAEMRRSAIVMGATASGKTTTLNAMSQFIPPALKIVSIEDTREITLQHENWLAAITREGFNSAGSDKVSMFDLLKAALRQRPDHLLVGEIRGVEGLTLFQAMSTGHTCFSTMHAGSVENAVYRLENAPINVPRVMLTALDFFIIQGQVNIDGRPQRRMLSLTEINGLDPQTKNLRVSELYRWDPTKDRHEAAAESAVFERARGKGGWTRTRLDEEFTARERVLEGLVERNERHYAQVGKAVRAFYAERADANDWVPGPVAPVAEAERAAAGIDFPNKPVMQPGRSAAPSAKEQGR